MRCYLFAENVEPVRLSQELVSNLVHDIEYLPQYAGTRQKVLTAYLEFDDGKPVRIVQTSGSVWDFDESGGIRKGLQDAIRLAMDSLPTRTPNTEQKVVQLRPRSNRRKLQEEFRWEPTTADIQRVVADIWPKRKTDRLAVVGSGKKRVPLTYEARHALEDISKSFWQISQKIDDLKEPGLKGFSYEARERASVDLQYKHLYLALAEMSDFALALARQRRTGKGTWYAIVSVIRWDAHFGDPLQRHHERCEGRKKAVLEARRLLAEHAHEFDDYITVEAEIVTELEWKRDWGDRDDDNVSTA